ncbi:non-homologous end-joining DNA ligase [Nocardiopsis changdeensis]|uniref:non-homologous end-joining DNA ligase n=1 Tax=Nocardiopsis TaxID=2013 RepID=UPI002107BC17|nr:MULTISPECIES: non-homologous end-joining DNA ligase [Nocardiopsis]
MGDGVRIRAGRRVVEVKRPDKELFGAGGPTKEDLARYHLRIAPLMLPHLKGRPVALERYPGGVGKTGFFVKHPSVPDWVRTLEIEGEPMMEARDAATLVWCADQAAITLHAWQSREPRLGRPDLLILDLDPPDTDPGAFAACKAAARDAREVLEEAGLAAYVMTTGSKGLHVRSPLRPELDDQEVRDLAKLLAERVAERAPGERTTEVRKNKREGRLFVDYLRNGREQLAVAPYSVRVREGAPVAAPLFWEELDGLESPRAFGLDLEREECPFRGMHRRARSPKRARDRLGRPRAA